LSKYKVLNKDLINKIDHCLSLFEFGELIIIRHDKKITMDVKPRDRIYITEIKNYSTVIDT